MNWIIELTDKVLNGGEVTREEAERLINVSDDDTMLLLAMADKIRQKFNGNAVDCCAIINGRSGRCPENCKFCAQLQVLCAIGALPYRRQGISAFKRAGIC